MRRKKLMMALGCLLLAVAMLSAGTVAWLSKSQKAETAYTVLSDFEVEGILTFGDEENPYTGNTITVPISFTKGSGLNYIGDMKYTVRYTGASPAYLRVRVLEQWTDLATNEIVPVSFLPYALAEGGAPKTPPAGTPAPTTSPIPAAGSGDAHDPLAESGGWVDNRKSDYCYYFTVPVQPKMLANNGSDDNVVLGDGAVELTLLNPVGADVDDLLKEVDAASLRLELVIEVEAVQPNRYREFWGIETLPF